MSETEIICLFDIRLSGVADSLRCQRDGWGESAEIEALDEDHLVLIIRSGGALRLLA